MKKTIILILTLSIILGVFSSCGHKTVDPIDDQTSSSPSEDMSAESTFNDTTESNETNQSENTETDDRLTVTEEPPETRMIEIKSLDKLSEMRKMSVCNDDATLAQYIQSISATGIQNKGELTAFVKLVDSLPNISILDGSVTWIRLMQGIAQDTGKEFTVLYVATEAENGDWTRVEYVLSAADVSREIFNEKISIGENSLLVSSVKNSDGDLTIHTETRNPHPSGTGTMIQWVGEVKGIFTRIYYYSTGDAANVNTGNIFSNLHITDIS